MFFLFLSPDKALLYETGYTSLVGKTAESWGWDLGRSKAIHDLDNQKSVTYPPFLRPEDTFSVPEKFLGSRSCIF